MTTDSKAQAALDEAFRVNAEYQRLKQVIRDLRKSIEYKRNIWENSQDDRGFGRYEGYDDVYDEINELLEKYKIEGL